MLMDIWVTAVYGLLALQI